jgi:hypothetical protein
MLDDEYAEALEEFLYKYGYEYADVAAKHLPGRHDQQRHDPYKGRATAPAPGLPDNYEDNAAARRYLKGVMHLERPGAERYIDVIIPNAERKKWKKQVMQDLAADTGLSEERVNELVASWASTSNDEDPASLGLQVAAKHVFGAELTDWQRSRVEWATERVANRNTFIDAREDGKKLLTAMHSRTQEMLSGLDTVTVYRGVKGSTIEGLEPGSRYDVKFNAVESWSLDSSAAKYFASNIGPGSYDAPPVPYLLPGGQSIYVSMLDDEYAEALEEFLYKYGYEYAEVEIVWSSEEILF